MNILEVQSVSKSYRKDFWAKKIRSVCDLSFSVPANRIVGFVGPNGAGKTTTIKMIMGLVHPDFGTLSLCGKPAANPFSRANVSYLSEQPYFYEYLTPHETLDFTCRLRRIPAADIKKEIGRVLDEVRLADVRGKKVRELSKGMQQRLNMATALVGDCETYIFDEPMSGLDPLGRSLFRDIFQSLVRGGKTVFFSTHILDDVQLLCDSVVVLEKGKLVYDGAVADLLARGFLGTEIAVTLSGLSSEHCHELEQLGYKVTSSVRDMRVFVGKDKDPQKCLAWLVEHGISFETVEKKNESLEKILYKEEL